MSQIRFIGFALRVAAFVALTSAQPAMVEAKADWGPKVGRVCTQQDFAGKVFRRVEVVQSRYYGPALEAEDVPFYYYAFTSNLYVRKGFSSQPPSAVALMQSLLKTPAADAYSFNERSVLTLHITHDHDYNDPTSRHLLICRVAKDTFANHRAGDLVFERHAHVTTMTPQGPQPFIDIIAQFFRKLP